MLNDLIFVAIGVALGHFVPALYTGIAAWVMKQFDVATGGE